MKPSTELKELVLSMYRSYEKGDVSFIENLMTKDDAGLVIGTAPDEWFTGYEKIVKQMRGEEEIFEGSVFTGDPQAYSSGNTGWAADQMTLKLSDGTEIPARITIVFEKEEDDWKIVQWHASVGIPNEDVGFGDI